MLLPYRPHCAQHARRYTETEFAVWFGGTESNGVVTPTGSEGKFEFKGKLSVFVVKKNHYKERIDDICKVINYFSTYFDKEKELFN